MFQVCRHPFKPLLLPVALLLGATLPAYGQEGPPAIPQLGRLGPTSVVRATLPDGRRLTGRFVAMGDGHLGVRAESGLTDTLSLGLVRTLDLRGRHTKTGAIIGGSAGLAAGLFFGWFIGALCDAAVCDRAEPFLLTIPIFAGGGTLLGAAIGAAVPKWKQIYP